MCNGRKFVFDMGAFFLDGVDVLCGGCDKNGAAERWSHLTTGRISGGLRFRLTGWVMALLPLVNLILVAQLDPKEREGIKTVGALPGRISLRGPCHYNTRRHNSIGHPHLTRRPVVNIVHKWALKYFTPYNSRVFGHREKNSPFTARQFLAFRIRFDGQAGYLSSRERTPRQT